MIDGVDGVAVEARVEGASRKEGIRDGRDVDGVVFTDVAMNGFRLSEASGCGGQKGQRGRSGNSPYGAADGVRCRGHRSSSVSAGFGWWGWGSQLLMMVILRSMPFMASLRKVGWWEVGTCWTRV